MSGFLPKPYKKEPITIRIKFEKLHKIDELAQRFDMSRSEFINQCIDFAIGPDGSLCPPAASTDTVLKK